MALPMPRVPPVTNATLLMSCSWVPLMFWFLVMGGSDGFDAHGHAHAAADAQGGKALLGAGPLHLVQQGGQHPRAGSADRVADGDGAAVDVDLGRVQAEAARHAQG